MVRQFEIAVEFCRRSTISQAQSTDALLGHRRRTYQRRGLLGILRRVDAGPRRCSWSNSLSLQWARSIGRCNRSLRSPMAG
jgi:hypothetical protein